MADGGLPYVYSPSARDRLVARAQMLANAAVKRGFLPEVETQKCVDCGEPAECWDHRNYYHPLAVDAVCKGCNNRRGPGFPPLKECDGNRNKNPLGRKGGYCWEGFAAGEGWTPEVSVVHFDVDWVQLECDHDEAQDRENNAKAEKAQRSQRRNADFTFSTGLVKTTRYFQRGHPLVLGVPGFQRYEFFKSHEPWGLT